MSIGPITPKPKPPPPPPKPAARPEDKKTATTDKKAASESTKTSSPDKTAAAPASSTTQARPVAPAPKGDAFAVPGTKTAPVLLKPTAAQTRATGMKEATAAAWPADLKKPTGPSAPAQLLSRAASPAAATAAAQVTPSGKSAVTGTQPSTDSKTTGPSAPTSSEKSAKAQKTAEAVRSALSQAVQTVRTAAQAAQAEKDAELTAAQVSSPQGPAQQQTVSGEDRARQETEVKTVSKSHDETLQAQQRLNQETNSRADRLLSLADSKDLPPGLTVTKNGNEAVLERKNAQGELLERTVATKGDNGAVSLDTSSYKDGKTSHDRVEMGSDGSSRVQRASYASATNDVGAPKSFDDLGNSRDAGIAYSDNQVHTENGSLHLDEYQQKGDGSVTSSRTSYATQDGLKHIDDKLKPLFGADGDRNKTDRADTYSYSIPAPGADGSQGDPTFTHTASYSQGNAQVTSVVQRDLDGHKQYAGTGNHTRTDVESVRDQYGKHGGENYDADDGTKAGKTPKQWVAEYQKDPNTVQTQSFVEGSPDNTLTTTKTREGNTVHEDYQGKTLKPDAKSSKDLVDVSGTSSRTYAEDGSISAMESQRHDADGSDVHQKYTSQRTATAQGLELDEHNETQITRDSKTTSSMQDTTSLLSSKGAQLTSAHSEVTDEEGRKATHELGPHGEKLSLTDAQGANARDINSAADLANDPNGQQLLNQAAVSTAETIQSYAGGGGSQALSTLQGLSDGADKLPAKASQILGADHVSQALQAARGLTSAAGGVAGAVAGGMQLADGIRNHNTPEIFKGLADTASGAKNLYDAGTAGKDFLKSINAIGQQAAPAADAAGTGAAAAGEAAANTSRWAGLAGGKLGAGVASALDAVKGMGGITNVAGAAVSAGSGIYDIVDGVKNHDAGEIAKGAVGIAGGIGSAIAVAAVGGPIGMAIGAGIGLLVWGIDKIIDRIEDKEHQISHLKIGPPPPEPSPDDYIVPSMF